MPWPVHDSWNQHLDELNAREYSRALKVSIVRIEGPFDHASTHVRHVHPYWQMSVVRKRSFSVNFDDMSLTPEGGDIMFIPPRNWHYFDFSSGKGAWTVKFVLEGLEEKFKPGLLTASPERSMLHGWLLELLESGSPDSPMKLVMLEHLLSSALDLYFFGQDIEGSETGIVRKARLFIEERLQQGRGVKAVEVASGLGLCPAYLTRVFKAQLGIPLKVYIDQQRFDMARKLLSYSGGNVGETAAELGFDDVFRFSRFFKRMSGMCPMSYLKEKGGRH